MAKLKINNFGKKSKEITAKFESISFIYGNDGEENMSIGRNARDDHIIMVEIGCGSLEFTKNELKRILKVLNKVHEVLPDGDEIAKAYQTQEN